MQKLLFFTSTLYFVCSTERQAPLLKFQILSESSLAPVTSLRPAGSNAMAVISALPWQWENCMVFSPVSTSHTLTTEPWQPLTTCQGETVHPKSISGLATLNQVVVNKRLVNISCVSSIFDLSPFRAMATTTQQLEQEKQTLFVALPH